MREIHGHETNAVNKAIRITADERDEKNDNGSHEYTLVITDEAGKQDATIVNFQHGPIKEVGTNGVTNEALIAIVVDRLQGFQSGPFACRENAIALTKLEEAQHWLFHRSAARAARGVEGTRQV